MSHRVRYKHFGTNLRLKFDTDDFSFLFSYAVLNEDSLDLSLTFNTIDL